MLTDISLDLGTVALLAFVIWLDGWRRMSDDALLVARTGIGPWTVRAPWTRAGAFALVAWWEPFVLPIILAPTRTSESVAVAPWTQDFQVASARATRRLQRVRPNIAFLRGLGALLVVWIIVGIPLATARFGGQGLIYGVIGAFALAGEIAMIATLSMQMLGIPFRRSLGMTASLLSPFGAPRAAGLVAGTAAGPLESLAPVVGLLGDARFLQWLRPSAYDVLAGAERSEQHSDGVLDLVRALPREVLEQAVIMTSGEAAADEARSCPRCARAYRDSVTECDDCGGLALVAVPERLEVR